MFQANTVHAQAFGLAVRNLRKRAGWSQEQFADIIGMDRTRLARIEKGQLKGGPSWDLFAKLERTLGRLSILFLEAEREAERIRDAPHQAPDPLQVAYEQTPSGIFKVAPAGILHWRDMMPFSTGFFGAARDCNANRILVDLDSVELDLTLNERLRVSADVRDWLKGQRLAFDVAMVSAKYEDRSATATAESTGRGLGVIPFSTERSALRHLDQIALR